MELEKFKDANKDELSMIEVAHEILHQRGETMAFADLTNEIQVYLGKSDEEIRDRLAQFYTDLNIDGSFISLGDNVWGLRSWYPYDSIDEALVHGEDEEDEERPRKKRKKVNAFLADVSDDDDVIDYDDDDPEDEDSYEADPALNYGEDNPDDEKSEVEAYDAEINEIAPDDLGEEVELNEEDEDYSDDEVDGEDEE